MTKKDRMSKRTWRYNQKRP